MKNDPLYCDACKKECRKNSRPVASKILCNECHIKFQAYGHITLANETRVAPLPKINIDPNIGHEEAIKEFEKVPGSFTTEGQYWACGAGFINGYEIAMKKFEVGKIKAQIEALKEAGFAGNVVYMVRRLEKQLKELEDETKEESN